MTVLMQPTSSKWFQRGETKSCNRIAKRNQVRATLCGQVLETRQLLAADAMMIDHLDSPAAEVSMPSGGMHGDGMSGDEMLGDGMHDHTDHGSHLSPKMAREMTALFDLVRDEDVTHTPLKNGRWLDPSVWGGTENMPIDGARVLIPADIKITVNGVIDARLMSVRVDGKLRFATSKDTQLNVDTMIVTGSGELKIGTAAHPIEPGFTARLVIDDYNGGFNTDDADAPDYDPYQLGNGLISHGKVFMQGQAKTSHATLATEPSVGDQSLTFDALPGNWAIGDELIIAGTSSDSDGDEVRMITAIDVEAGSVTLDTALTKDHKTPQHTRAGVELKVHVANTTRNAIIETAQEHRGVTKTVTVPTGDTAKNRTGDVSQGRGHVMFMHNNDVKIRHAGFYHLGRTNKMIPVHDTSADEKGTITEIGLNPRARYAIHFHRAGTETEPGKVQGSAVVNTPGWGFVNHSSNVDMTGNVAFDAVGSGFVTEAGDESGSFVGNISIRSHGSDVPMNRRSSVNDFGHGGHGFWFQGSGITVRDNVASGSSDTGIAFWPIGIDGLDDTVRSIKVEQFLNNTIYGSDVGFLVGQHENAGSEFVGTTIYGVRHGLEFFYPEGLIYKDTTIIGDLENPAGMGIKMHHRAGPFQFFDTHIEGFDRGFETPRDNVGNAIEGVYLNNVANFVMINGRRHFPLELIIRGDVQFGSLSQTALAGKTPYNFVLEESESAANIARFNHLVLPYKVILDYDSIQTPARVYFDSEQSPDHVVWPVAAFENTKIHRSNSDVPEVLRGLTNQQLKEFFEQMTPEERIEMLSKENRFVYQENPDAYYSFGGEIRPVDSELLFPSDFDNGALLELSDNDALLLKLRQIPGIQAVPPQSSLQDDDVDAVFMNHAHDDMLGMTF